MSDAREWTCEETKIILRNKALRRRAIEKLEQVKIEPLTLEMVIREHKSTRSGQQNRRLHKLLGMMAEYTGDDLESMKLEMKAKFLEPEAQKNLPDGRVWVQFPSTARMNVKELNQFMEQVEAFAAIELNIALPADV